VKLPLPISFAPDAPDLAERLDALRGSRGIYLLAIAGAQAHLGWSVNLHRRLSRWLVSSYPGSGAGISSLRQRITTVSCWLTGSKLETSLFLYEVAKLELPTEYRKYLKLRMPWFVGLKTEDRFPRLEVMNRLPQQGRALYGPFRTRDAAQLYEQEVLGLFQIRRCTEVLNPHPGHPGCIYGEMSQCMRPCQCAVSETEYGSEAERVADFLATNGKSALSVLTIARDRASGELEFEQASQIQKRLERVQGTAKARDEVVRAVEEFNGVAVTSGTRPLEFRLWPMLGGIWQPAVSLDFSAEQVPAKSLDSEIRERLGAALANVDKSGNRLEQLALFSRWYYSSWREGRWFPFRTLDNLNYRGLVREVSKMAEQTRRVQENGP